MNEYYQITEAPMEQKDKNKFRNGLLLMPIFYVVWGVMAYFMFNKGLMLWGRIGLNTFLVFSVFFLGIITWMSRAAFLDWKSGVKQIIKGIITRKEHQISSSHGSSHSRSQGSKSRTKHTYYLHFDDFQLTIQAHHYNKVSEGDLVEFHYGKRTHNIIQDIILEKNALAKLELKDIKLHEPKKPKEIPKYMIFVLFLALIPLFMTGVFTIIADCFACEPEYNKNISEWVSYESNYDNADPAIEKCEQIILMLNDTLTDAEEGQIIKLFTDAAHTNEAGKMLEYLSQRSFDNSSKSGFQMLERKFNEDLPSRPTTTINLWKSTLFAITNIESFHIKTEYPINDFNFSDLVSATLIDDKLTLSQGKILFRAYNNVKTMQFRLKSYIKRDTTLYSNGVNTYFKEIYSLPNKMGSNSKYKYIYDDARKIYGLE